MSIEFDIACLRAPCDPNDVIGVTQLIARAKMAADQIEDLIKQVEALREFTAEAVQWSEAYPEHIFTAPTPEQVDAVCKTLGFRIDRIAAMVLREFTGRWSEKAKALLAATESNL